MSSFVVPGLALDEFIHGRPIPMLHREFTGHPIAWLYVSFDLVNDAIASAIQGNHIFILRILSHSFLQFIWFVDSVSLKMVQFVMVEFSIEIGKLRVWSFFVCSEVVLL